MAALALISFPVLPASAAQRGGDEGAIQNYLDVSLHAPRVAFRSAEAELGPDKKKEIVVYVTSPDFCGSGGCRTLILQRAPSGFRTVMNATVTHLPIRLLKTRTHGWRDIGVLIAGGGVMSPYEARLRFDGRHYPWNPTVAPAEPLAGVSGEVLIADEVR